MYPPLPETIKLYSCYDVNSSQSDLLVAISRLYNWSCLWQLQIAVEKCFVCTVSNSRHNNSRSSNSYGINNQAFAVVDNVRDLGVTIDSQLKFDKHIYYPSSSSRPSTKCSKYTVYVDEFKFTVFGQKNGRL